jgi:hypothetical protein
MPKKDIGTMDVKYGNTAYKTPIEERNAINPELGLHIINRAFDIIQSNNVKQGELF